MNKVVRWVGATGVAALTGLLLFGAAGMYSASEVEAQSPPAPPATFAGSVTIDGAPAPVGAVVQARINGNNCSLLTGIVYHEGGEARYNQQVAANHPDNPGCGSEGATVTFYVDGVQASPTAPWIDYDVSIVNLTVTTAVAPTATPTTAPSDDDADDDDDTTATPATGTPTTPTTAATPRPPATGAGVGGGSSTGTLALLAVLVIGVGAFGAAGAAAARRK